MNDCWRREEEGGRRKEGGGRNVGNDR